MKRILTDQHFQQSPDATLAGDLAASIRAASMRARKSVTEGYLNSPPSSPLKQAPVALTASPAGYPLSARESNRQIFNASSGTYSPLPSPSKRKRSHPDSYDDDNSDNERSITPSPDRGHLPAELTLDDMVVDRPMKPLRRSRRIGLLSPLPHPPALFRSDTEMNSHQCEEVSSTMRSTSQLLLRASAFDNEQL